MPDLLTHALAYAKRGWMVLPLKPGEKTPLTPNGFKDATTNENIITRWWDRHPDANIGVATGKDSGFWVLDVGGPEGDTSLGALETELATLPRTLEQATGGGGRQFLFRWPASCEIRNKQGIRPGIDVRGEGGYVVVPPSLHPSGKHYEWTDGKDTVAIADAPSEWLEFIAPAKRVIPPWERLTPAAPPPPPPVGMTHAPILERARRYLEKCPPAVQGQGGHNALLWAARVLVVGFELDDSTAIGLLWSEYNPRCTPPWNRGKEGDVRDFERKVGQARWTPGDKPRGWLLDEYGLRASTERLAQIGRESAENLLSQPLPAEDANTARGSACGTDGAGKPTGKPERPAVPDQDRDAGWREFPLDIFPASVGDFIRVAALSHSVNHAAVVLPLLATASAAIGNAWRLKLKEGFLVPPTLWTIFVALSGANKSGPLDLVTVPMWTTPPAPEGDQVLAAGMQGQYVIDDATREAVTCRLSECPRGLLLVAPELGQWVQSFNAYRPKGGGGDEHVWIRLWDTKPYRLDRKTNNEQRVLHAPAVAIAGAIQPTILEKAADAESLASGLFARALLAMPPDRLRRWEADGVPRKLAQFWADTVNAMRGRPFASFNPNTGSHDPHVVDLSPEAADAWEGCFEAVAQRVHVSCGVERALAAKSDNMAARLALVLYGLECAVGSHEWGAPMPARVMQAGVRAARWFLDESLRVFEAVCRTARDEGRNRLARLIAGERYGGSVTVRDLQRSSDRYNGPGGSEHARADLRDLAAAGRGTFQGDRFTMVVT